MPCFNFTSVDGAKIYFDERAEARDSGSDTSAVDVFSEGMVSSVPTLTRRTQLTPSSKISKRKTGTDNQIVSVKCRWILLYRVNVVLDPFSHGMDELSSRLVVDRIVPQNVPVLLLSGDFDYGLDKSGLAHVEFLLLPLPIFTAYCRVIPGWRVRAVLDELDHGLEARDTQVLIGEAVTACKGKANILYIQRQGFQYCADFLQHFEIGLDKGGKEGRVGLQC